MGKIMGTIWVCTDCMLVEANGECDPERPADLPEPLSAIGDGFSVTLGGADHSEWCTREADGECDCDRNTFSTSSCDGCGDSHHGERHALTLWLERHLVTERRYGPDGDIRRAHCTCGGESFPIADGWSVEEVARGHAVDGVLVASPSWGFGARQEELLERW
jgi:hypothetical protein